jgi:drug/metabolite transporter (DMT)-like permease
MRGKSNASVPAGVTVPLAAWGALGIVYVVWGSTYLAIKVSIETLPPLVSAAVRFSGAALLLLGIIAVARPRTLRITREQFVTAACSGVLLLVGGNGMVVLAEERISSGLAALLVSTTPLWVVVLRSILGDRPAGATFVGVALGFLGVAVLLSGGGAVGGSVWHSLLVVGAAFSWACGSLLTTRRPMPANPFVGSVIQMAAGGVILGVIGLLRGELRGFELDQVSTRSALALLYLLIVGSVIAFSAYLFVLGQLPVSTVTTYAYVNPVFAVFLGAVLLGERVSPTVLLGGGVIVAAVAVVVTAEGRQRRNQRRAAEADERRSAIPADLGGTAAVCTEGDSGGSVRPAGYSSASPLPAEEEPAHDLPSRSGQRVRR